MTPTVAIVAPGSMGSGVARRLTENKVTVLTTLKGRSEASVARAREAGMKDVDERQLMEADFFLSIVPPGQAMALAKHFAPLLSATNRKPVYADCNAVEPGHHDAHRRGDRGNRRALRRRRHHRPTAEAGLEQHQIIHLGRLGGRTARHARRLRPDRARARRPAHRRLRPEDVLAGITKGFTALGTAMLLAASRGGAAEALQAELADSRPDLLGYLSKMVPGMYSKAYRWVAELDEISEFVGKDHPESAMLAGAARLYERMADDFEGDKQEIAALDRFLGR